MKDIFSHDDLSEKTSYFIFECEVFDDEDEIAQSRDIQIELADYELLSANLIN